MKYVKLIAKPNTWFKEGTEVYHYDFDYEDRKMITLEEYNKCLHDDSMFRGICVRGIRENGEEDGEFCPFDEFNVEIIEE